MTTYAKMRYNLFNDGGDWFQGDKPKSIEHLRGLDFSACLKNSPHKEIIPKILEETFKMLDGEKVIRLSQS
jgi:predicted aldo/keto reductase-like oxidoreductase